MSGTKPAHLFELEGMHDYQGTLYLPFMPPSLIDETSRFEMSEGDILFGTFPRSATPLLCELMWLIHNDGDVESARKTHQGVRVRFMEHHLAEGNPLDMLRGTPHPRLLKTHLPATFFAEQIEKSNIKIINMSRNPKDVLVSLFHFYKMPQGYIKFPGDWNDFFDIFKADQLFGGNWFKHVLSWNTIKDRDNVLLIKYEDVRQQTQTIVKKVASFCEKNLSENKVRIIADYITKEVREESPMGGWKDYFTVEQNQYFDRTYRQKMKQNGLEFQYLD